MMMQRNGWIKKTNSFAGFTLGKKLMVEAVNHLGYEVQEFRNAKEGWVSAIEEQTGFEADGDTPIYKPMIVGTRGLAEDLMEEMKTLPGRIQRELRVAEVVEFPVKKVK
jgi:hypothetical protein